MDLPKFAQRKCDTKVCKLRSITCANVVNAAFAHLFTQGCKQVCKSGIYHLCTGFALQFAHFCIIFALSKFGQIHFFVQWMLYSSRSVPENLKHILHWTMEINF